MIYTSSKKGLLQCSFSMLKSVLPRQTSRFAQSPSDLKSKLLLPARHRRPLEIVFFTAFIAAFFCFCPALTKAFCFFFCRFFAFQVSAKGCFFVFFAAAFDVFAAAPAERWSPFQSWRIVPAHDCPFHFAPEPRRLSPEPRQLSPEVEPKLFRRKSVALDVQSSPRCPAAPQL